MAAMVAAVMMCGCTSDEFMQQPQTPSGEGIPFTATISGKAATRAITENTTDNKLETSWAVNEQVALIHNSVVDVMTVSAISDDGAATITGTITGSPKDGDEVQVVYPASAVDPMTKEVKANLLASQDGTLATIASKFDLRTASGAKLKVGPASATITSAVSLTNQIAIVKFSLSDGTEALAADKFEITDISDQTITTVTPSTATSYLYVAMDPATTQTFRFTAKKGDAAYYYSKYGATLAAGTYYQSPMTLADMLQTPLTLEVAEDDTEITITNAAGKTIQYRVNGKDKISITNTENITGLKAGDIVQFFSTNASLYANQENLNIKPSKKTYVYGNAMSLIDDGTEGFAKDKGVAEHALKGLFLGAANLYTHASRKFVLPATELQASCYYNMFKDCTSLNNLPEDLLPATTARSLCYNGMFYGCTSLTAAPKLPAEVLSGSCYQYMFSGCTSLTAAPKLPAAELKDHCYYRMFYGCTSLTTAPELKATTLAGNCCNSMFYGCTSLTTAPELKAEVLKESCYASMFEGCTNLTTAPTLAANTLVKNCYESMFKGCSMLSSVTCLATTDQDNWFPLIDWLTDAGTAEGITSRTLYVNPATTITNWQLATSGNGNDKIWTTSNYVAKSCAISELTTKEIGWRLGSDGVAYEPVGILPGGVKARAIIAYVGKVDKYFDHFLAIALEDVDDNYHTWAEALTAVGTYAAAHPITIESTTYNTSTTGSTYYDRVASDQTTTSATRSTTTLTLKQGWRLPSVTDWRYVFDGLGRIKGGLTLTAKSVDESTTYSSHATPTDPLGVLDGMYYYKNGDPVGNSSLRAAINTACGNTALQSVGYWSSSEYSNDSDPGAWDYNFNGGEFWWSPNNFYVRAVFAY